MLWIRRAPVVATATFAATMALIGCANATPASPLATFPAAATPAVTALASIPATTPAPTLAPTVAPSLEPSVPGSAGAPHPPITTPVPGSSLDPSLSDAGVVGRITIPVDTRDSSNNRTGTSQIIGLAADGSECSYSLDGNELTAVAWYDAAPNGMLHQMAVTVPTDTVPANDGEQRAGINDGRVYADFVSDSGFGTAYSGDASKENSGTVSIDMNLTGGTLVFTFTGTTWDEIDFSGQMMCTGMGG